MMHLALAIHERDREIMPLLISMFTWSKAYHAELVFSDGVAVSSDYKKHVHFVKEHRNYDRWHWIMIPMPWITEEQEAHIRLQAAIFVETHTKYDLIGAVFGRFAKWLNDPEAFFCTELVQELLAPHMSEIDKTKWCDPDDLWEIFANKLDSEYNRCHHVWEVTYPDCMGDCSDIGCATTGIGVVGNESTEEESAEEADTVEEESTADVDTADEESIEDTDTAEEESSEIISEETDDEVSVEEELEETEDLSDTDTDLDLIPTNEEEETEETLTEDEVLEDLTAEETDIIESLDDEIDDEELAYATPDDEEIVNDELTDDLDAATGEVVFEDELDEQDEAIEESIDSEAVSEESEESDKK